MNNIKKYAAAAVKYKNELNILLGSLDSKDIEQGLLLIKDSLFTKEFKPMILSKSMGMLTDYNLAFSNGSIHLNASINARQLGPISVDYYINIQELRFDDTGHKLYATFTENATSLGNMAQKLAFKAALMNNSLLKTAVKYSKSSFAYVDGNNILLDFDKFDFAEKLPANLTLSYISSKDSILTLSFNI